jgi:hypothetical protein
LLLDRSFPTRLDFSFCHFLSSRQKVTKKR